MTTMLADPVLSDVCLVVEGIDVPAHKAILGEKYYFHAVRVASRVVFNPIPSTKVGTVGM